MSITIGMTYPMVSGYGLIQDLKKTVAVRIVLVDGQSSVAAIGHVTDGIRKFNCAVDGSWDDRIIRKIAIQDVTPFVLFAFVNLYATKNIAADNQRLILAKRAKGRVEKTMQEWLWPFS